MDLVILLTSLLIAVAITCLPLVIFRRGLFASDDALGAQMEQDRRDAARAAKGDAAILAMRLENAREVRAHRRLRDFAFSLTILPALLAIGALVFALLAGALVIAGGTVQR